MSEEEEKGADPKQVPSVKRKHSRTSRHQRRCLHDVLSFIIMTFTSEPGSAKRGPVHR